MAAQVTRSTSPSVHKLDEPTTSRSPVTDEPNSAAQSGVALPDPDACQACDVVIYDGECVFCLDGVRRLHRWDHNRRLSFLSLHDPRVRQRYPDLTHEMLMDKMYVIDQQGHQYSGADALRYLSRRLPPLWILMPLLHVPGTMPLWRWLYGQVAKRRYRLRGRKEGACNSGACEVHFDRPKRTDQSS